MDRPLPVTPSVLFIGINYAPEPTGIGPYTTGMAVGLAKRGWSVDVVTGFPHYPWWRVSPEHRALPAWSTSEGVRVRRVRHFVPRRHSAATRALHELTFGLRAITSRWNRPDLVVLVSPAMLASRIAAVKARLFGVPVVTWVQDIYTLGVQETEAGPGAGLISRWERGLAHASRRVVVIHQRFRRMMVEDLRVERPVDVVRNWSHVPALHDRRDATVRRALGWRPDEIIVLHAGNMGAKQGLENVVHASRIAATNGSRVRFVLLGDGNQRRALEAMGGNSHLQFLDPMSDDDFHGALSSADILLVNERPGLTEMSVPSKMTTYFATGLPVVASVDPRSTTYDEMSASGAGPCVPADDPAALVAAAEALADDYEGARALGMSGRNYRERVLSESAAIEHFEAVLIAALSDDDLRDVTTLTPESSESSSAARLVEP